MYEKLLAKIYDLIPERRAESQYYTARVLQESADAIEELQGQIDGWVEQERKALIKSLPKWIPATERVPDKNDDVLIYGEWAGASGTKYRGIWLTDLKGFLHQGYKPIAWMPLPEPPKETI